MVERSLKYIEFALTISLLFALGNSLVVQWLGLGAFTAVDLGFQLGVGHKVAVTGHLRKQPSEGLLEAGGSLPRWLTHMVDKIDVGCW